MPKQLDELGFPSKMEHLQEQVNRLGEDKAGREEVMEDLAKTSADFTQKLEALEGVRADIALADERIVKLGEDLEVGPVALEPSGLVLSSPQTHESSC